MRVKMILPALTEANSLWDWLIRTRRVFHALPLLESVLDRFGRHPAGLVEPRRPAIAGRDHPRSRQPALIGEEI